MEKMYDAILPEHGIIIS